MDVQSLVDQASDTLSIRRVVGDPVERDGVTIIPVVALRGGGGGGGGDDGAAGDGAGAAGGGGFGLQARPVGAYVIRDGDVRFEPAIDWGRIVLGSQLLAALALLVVRSIVRMRALRG